MSTTHIISRIPTLSLRCIHTAEQRRPPMGTQTHTRTVKREPIKANRILQIDAQSQRASGGTVMRMQNATTHPSVSQSVRTHQPPTFAVATLAKLQLLQQRRRPSKRALEEEDIINKGSCIIHQQFSGSSLGGHHEDIVRCTHTHTHTPTKRGSR
eukprot:GHVU01106350.1.p1 GENE.GHVU01106350.1~~GHVU01106350.1.p1  ORF type:complete len:155 (-),score=23.98 GHVU01106350.1:31-495(-)